MLNGGRLLCLTEPQSGLVLEKKLAPADAVVRQKEKLLQAFEAALARGELTPAQILPEKLLLPMLAAP